MKIRIICLFLLVMSFCTYARTKKADRISREYDKLEMPYWVRTTYGSLIEGMEYRALDKVFPIHVVGTKFREMRGVTADTEVETRIYMTKKQYDCLKRHMKNGFDFSDIESIVINKSYNKPVLKIIEKKSEEAS